MSAALGAIPKERGAWRQVRGACRRAAGGSEHGYILFYQKVAPDGEDEEETFLEEEAFLA